MVVFYAGSFDPFTNGHLSIVKKASQCFERVIVGIGDNDVKHRRVDKSLMLEAIKQTLEQEQLNNVEVITYDGLTTKEAKKYGCTMLIRGLRNGTDYQYEENIASINQIHDGLDTCYLRAGNLGHLSSSIVMDLFNNGEDVSNYVPKAVNEVLVNRKIG